MTNCCECGKRIKGRLTTENAIFYKGKYWCKECFEEQYFKCEYCGEIVSTNDRYYDYREREICGDCVSSCFYTCDDCGELVEEDDAYTTYNHRHICPNCEDRDYSICNSCERRVHYEDRYDYNGECYCPDCYDEIDKTIYDYHEFEDFFPYKMPDESRLNPTFGFEIEVAGDKSYASEIISMFNDHAIAMSDSSVDGFEIVTQPMTERYFEEKFVPILEKVCKRLDLLKFKGHNKGGIHIHVNEEAFTLHMIKNLVQILYGTELDRNTWLMLSQRKESEMKSWARMTGNRPYEEIDIYDHVDWERHTALNYDERTNTYEFRIFNSNTRIERIKKNFEIVLALMAYSKEEEEGYADTKGFLKYVDSRKLFYPNLAAFMQEKGIMEHYNKIYTAEELEVA